MREAEVRPERPNVPTLSIHQVEELVSPGQGSGTPDQPLSQTARKKLRASERAERRLKRNLDARRTVADDRPRPQGEPTPERVIQGEVIPVRHMIVDAGGKMGSPRIAIDTLSAMERRSTITARMRMAAERFRTDFRMAGMDPLRAVDLAGAGGSKGERGTITEQQERARRRVNDAMGVFGGRTSPAGSVIWSVVGEEVTLKDWRGKNGWGIRPLQEKTAAGVLVGALCALVAFYDGVKPSPSF